MTQTAHHAEAGDSSAPSNSARKPSRSQRRRDRRKYAAQRARENRANSGNRGNSGDRGNNGNSVNRGNNSTSGNGGNRGNGSHRGTTNKGGARATTSANSEIRATNSNNGENRTNGGASQNHPGDTGTRSRGRTSTRVGNGRGENRAGASSGNSRSDNRTGDAGRGRGYRPSLDEYEAPNTKADLEPHPANPTLHGRRGEPADTRSHGVIPPVEEAPFAAVAIRFARMHPTTGRMHALAITFLDAEGQVVSTWSTLLRTESSPGPAHLFGASPRDFDHAPEFADIVDAVDLACHRRIVFLHRTDITWGYLVNEARRTRARQLPRGAKGQSRWSVLKLKKMVPKPRVLMDTLETARRQGLVLPDARLRGVAALYDLVSAPTGAEDGNVFSELTELFPGSTTAELSPYRDDEDTLTFAAMQRIPGMGAPGHQRGKITLESDGDTLPQVGPRASDYRRVANPLEALQADANLTAALAVAQLAREGHTPQDLLDHADRMDEKRLDAVHTHEWGSNEPLDFSSLRVAPNGKLVPRTFSGNCAGGEGFVNFALRTPQELRADRYGIQRTRTQLRAQIPHPPLEAPPVWNEGEPLQEGMIVCIAPEIDIDPDLVVAATQAAGLLYTEKLLRETALVVCDGPTDERGQVHPQQGAAMHAFRKGIPLVRPTEFFALAEDLAGRRR